MIGIGIATAAAGIIVGTVTLTGIGLPRPSSWSHLRVAAADGDPSSMVAIICLILGMGLPTTANYIVVSTLMAPVVVELGAQSGLLVPLIAVHLFVFYFGLMADVTPPVGLASTPPRVSRGATRSRSGHRLRLLDPHRDPARSCSSSTPSCC